MKGYSGDNGDDATHDDGALKPQNGAATPGARRMSLEGKEALDLYLTKIGRNASELQAQAELLQEALRERLELLGGLQSSPSDDDKRSR
jgi:hypothetical protein